MRKALLLLLFVVGGVAFALTVGSKAASASTLPLIQQEQSGTNQNRTSQDANADATTQQANVNLPISVLTWGANDGAVSQGNQADTKAFAKNVNTTDQDVDQRQAANAAGTGHGSGSIDQDQSAANDNRTDQSADAKSTTEQQNVNVPLALLGFGGHGSDSGCGCSKSHDPARVDQANSAKTAAYASTINATRQDVGQQQDAEFPASRVHDPHDGHDPTPCGCDSSYDPKSCGCDHNPSPPQGHPRDAVTQAQTGTNGNETTQHSDTDATTEQKNLNVPFSFFSWGGGKDGCGCPHAGHGSDHRGGVAQHNGATTTAGSENGNRTRQSLDQGQEALIGRR